MTNNRKPLILLLFSFSCAGPLVALNKHASVTSPLGELKLRHSVTDLEELKLVEESLKEASTRVAHLGKLEHSITVWLLPSHAALEQAVGRPYTWLNAWATYDTLYLQTPSSWQPGPVTKSTLTELLQHELIHCLMYQQSASRSDWTKKDIPLWFREGMASFYAQQGHRWPPLEALAQRFRNSQRINPLLEPEKLYAQDEETFWIYGSAHHAFAFLHRRYGESAIQTLMAHMKQGSNFPSAFERSLGVTPTAFTQDFLRYVRLRGFFPGKFQPTEISFLFRSWWGFPTAEADLFPPEPAEAQFPATASRETLQKREHSHSRRHRSH